jgi:dienelactone hydrolase
MTILLVATRRARRSRRFWVALLATALVGAAAVSIRGAAAGGYGSAPDPSRPGPFAVAAAEYTLGDSALQFHDPETGTIPVEVTASVHYPRNLSGRPHPLVVLLHGMWATCADQAALDAMTAAFAQADAATDPAEKTRLEDLGRKLGEPIGQWPCRTGVAPVPSYRGYDYLAQNLASYGFVAISVSANGVNAGSMSSDEARTAVINKHLALWQQLASTGGGPLAGKFTDPASHRPVAVQFRGRVDLTRVGTMGHSRGGRAVMWQAADRHRAQWPAGVQVKAVVPLAAVGPFDPDNPEVVADYITSSIPLLEIAGTCDGATRGDEYVPLTTGKSTAPLRQFLVHGANHNFHNTVWSPASGGFDSADDATHPAQGQCKGRAGVADPQLTEPAQRRINTGYESAFFQKHLLGVSTYDRILDGTDQPYASLTKIDVKKVN